MKICSTCKIEKDFNNFHVHKAHKTGYASQCKSCRSVYTLKYYNDNRETIKSKSMEQYRKDKPAAKIRMAAYNKSRIKTDLLYKLTRNLRNRLYYALSFKEWKKNTHFAEYIGCSLEELKVHLEVQFKPGMTWDNYGKWHIDHIVPLSSAKTEEDMYRLCHYTNLQPLCARENLIKGNK